MEVSSWLLWLGTRFPRFLGEGLPGFVFRDALLILISGGRKSRRSQDGL